MGVVVGGTLAVVVVDSALGVSLAASGVVVTVVAVTLGVAAVDAAFAGLGRVVATTLEHI